MDLEQVVKEILFMFLEISYFIMVSLIKIASNIVIKRHYFVPSKLCIILTYTMSFKSQLV